MLTVLKDSCIWCKLTLIKINSCDNGNGNDNGLQTWSIKTQTGEGKELFSVCN